MTTYIKNSDGVQFRRSKFFRITDADAVIDSYDDLETALVRVSPAFRACLAERS